MLDIQEGAAIQLNIVASDETGDVKGRVVENDKPLAGILVVVMPRTASQDLGRYRAFQTDSDGSFAFPRLPAGKYVLFATAALDLEYMNADVSRAYLESGQEVEVAAGSLWSADIGLAKVPDQR